MFKVSLSDGSELRITLKGFSGINIGQYASSESTVATGIVSIPFADIKNLVDLINRFTKNKSA